MNKISNAIKCVNCKSILESPVSLPCGHSICKKHSTGVNRPVLCYTCEIEHDIPKSGEFPPSLAIAEIIAARIDRFEFGMEHNEAKMSCEKLDQLISDIDALLNDPFNFTHDAIEYLKNVVQLKGEEMKLKIDEQMGRCFDKLDKYKTCCKSFLTTSDYLKEVTIFGQEKDAIREQLKKWLESLNELKFNEHEWKRIKNESELKIEHIQGELNRFKGDVLLQKSYKTFIGDIQHEFGKFQIDQTFSLNYHAPFYSEILHNSTEQLLELCEFKPNQKLKLLYRGSLHGFKASDFHSKCDNIPKTLTVIKATSGNIFGGYTSASWDKFSQSWVKIWQRNNGYKLDKSAFLFSLINKKNKPVKIPVKDPLNAILCYSEYGPVFGHGNDICIHDNSNEHNTNFSHLGSSYVLPEHSFGWFEVKSLLAGSSYFTVEEIEVFHVL